MADADSEPPGLISPPSAILVAIDFSPPSLRALDTALSWRPAGADITVLHVIDRALSTRLEEIGICSAAQAIARQRARAEGEIRQLEARGGFETMIVEGIPFVEILKIAADLACDLIVLGARGPKEDLSELLFGSTAEKVLRGARRAVLCVP